MSVEWLLDTAARLHDAALDPARWPDVLRAVRLRLRLGRTTGELSADHAAWLESMLESAVRLSAEVAALELTRAMAVSAIDGLPVGVVLVGADGRHLRANREADRLLRTLEPPALRSPQPGWSDLGASSTVADLAKAARTHIGRFR